MYRYIVIDDEKPTRTGTILKLAPLSDQLVCIGEAANGEDGLKLTEELHPDIVITDMKMPVLGGEQLLPILAEKYPDIYIVVISGYQDFEYSKQAIRANAVDYILKPFSEEEIIHSVCQAMKRLANATIVQSRIQESADYKEALLASQDIEKLRSMIDGYALEKPSFSSDRFSFVNRSASWNLVLLHAAPALPEKEINAFLSENEYTHICLYLPHRHAPTLGYLLFCTHSGISRDSQQLCQNLLSKLTSYLYSEGHKLQCGISEPHTSLSELYSASKESIQALNQLKFADTQTIFFHSTEPTEANAISWGDEAEFLFYVESGKTQEVTALVKKLFAYYRNLPCASLGDIKRSCMNISNQIKVTVDFYIIPETVSSSHSSVQNILNTLFSLNELEDYFQQFFANICQSLAPHHIYSDNDLVGNVKTYIERNYQKNISVEFVASLFHMNRTYLSHIFKKKHGSSFGDYLNLVRLEHAKTLLLQTDKKMYQIAKNAGYDNVRNLYRAFKKFEQTTPEQYRIMHQTTK
jgi:two-component system response regulator YesN